MRICWTTTGVAERRDFASIVLKAAMMPRYLSLLVCIAGFLCTTWPNAPTVAQSSEEIELWLRTHVPATEFRYAYQHYIGDGWPADQEKARLDLMLFALRRPSDFLARNRAYALEQGWRRSFIRTFDSAIEFAEKVRTSPPTEILILSRAFRANESEANQSVAQAILMIAVRIGHPDAEFEWSQQLLDSPREVARSGGRAVLHSLAEAGHRNALLDIIRRHRDGAGFTRDIKRAYYWALRGRDFGLPDSDAISELGAQLTQPEIRDAEQWVAKHAYVSPH